MLKVTDDARRRVLEFIKAENEPGLALRIATKGAGDFEFGLVAGSERAEGDVALDADGFEVLMDAMSAKQLEEATFEFVEAGDDSGFRIVGFGPSWKGNALAEEVQQVIDSKINPAVASHGGHVTLLDVKDDTAYVKMGGGCQGCGMAAVTLKQGIETMIREAVPAIVNIVDTTDHAGGTNPYYSPGQDAGSPPAGM